MVHSLGVREDTGYWLALSCKNLAMPYWIRSCESVGTASLFLNQNKVLRTPLVREPLHSNTWNYKYLAEP